MRVRLDFAWLVARRGLVEQFAGALKLLKRFKARPVFPIQRYRYHASLAIIADERGDREIARAAVQAALLAAQERSSPFRFHRNLGLVKPTAGDMRKRLERLARPFGKPTARPRGRT